MTLSKRVQAFRQLVEKKYQVFNALFLSLPFEQVANTGVYLPILARACEEGLKAGKSPLTIIDQFFEQSTSIRTEAEKVDFLFRVIQYVERQVVLFDSIEDASFPEVIVARGSNIDLGEYANLLKKEQRVQGVDEMLADFSVRLVFTAHPTQFYPFSVLDLINVLRGYIDEDNFLGIDQSLQQLGLTSFIKKEKPTPLEEAGNILYYLRHVYYDAISDFYYRVKYEVLQNEHFDNPQLIQVGFWPGGDRDGNPYVTAAITRQVADDLRMTLMKCYYNDIKALEKKLTFRRVEGPLRKLKNRLYASMFDEEVVIPYDELIAPMLEIQAEVEQHYNDLYEEDINRMIEKMRIFKTHFACLDIRQDHRMHRKTVAAVLEQNGLAPDGFDALDEDSLLRLLTEHELDLSPENYEDPIVRDTLENIRQLGEIQARNGEMGCNRYIISNSEDMYSVLFVFGLFRWCGWRVEKLRFDIVPLFETMRGMQGAEATMRKLFALPIYREHVQRRGDNQTMMLGFSDGTKDGGYLRANWSIYRTKEVLTRVCEENQVRALFFDGRGGPPARGGGKTHRFYASQGKTIANHEIQLTIQGQTITSTFGTKEKFQYNVGQMITAGMSNAFNDEESQQIAPHHRELLDELAQGSFQKYDALKQHPQFIPYLERMSTLKYYGMANIGSRPGKRGQSQQLTLDDLRAISFVQAWSQLKQNVPGYYGIGTVLRELETNNRLDEAKRLFAEVPFFRALINNSMMSLLKSYFPLTAYMRELDEFGAFWQMLYDEYQLSKKMLLRISGYEELMQEEPISRHSIRMREKIVLPLLTIQQYALQHLGQQPSDSQRDLYEKMVTRSLYGNINASRNSA